MKSLAVLQRLAKQAVDRERRALETIAAEIAEVEGQILHLRQIIEHETTLPLDVMTTGVTLIAFVEAKNQQARELEIRLQMLQHAYDVQIERVRAERIEEKRYEILMERRASQAAREREVKEQKIIDELAAVRHNRT